MLNRKEIVDVFIYCFIETRKHLKDPSLLQKYHITECSIENFKDIIDNKPYPICDSIKLMANNIIVGDNTLLFQSATLLLPTNILKYLINLGYDPQLDYANNRITIYDIFYKSYFNDDLTKERGIELLTLFLNSNIVTVVRYGSIFDYIKDLKLKQLTELFMSVFINYFIIENPSTLLKNILDFDFNDQSKIMLEYFIKIVPILNNQFINNKLKYNIVNPENKEITIHGKNFYAT